MYTSDLLPELPGLQLQQIFLDGDRITLTLQTTAASVPCPLCGQSARRVHSHYRRRLGDLPWQGRRVQLDVLARRFFCDTDDCPRHVFTERLPDVVAPYARTTARLTEAHCLLGFALGGEAGARLAAVLAMPTSPDTLLRRVRQAVLPESASPRVLGVDDWAFRRGHTYGTILHDALERAVDRHQSAIHQAAQAEAARPADPPLDPPPTEPALVLFPPSQETSVEQSPAPPPRHEVRRSRRLQRYEQVVALHNQGLSRRAIADRLGLDRGTVRRYVEADSFPERATRRSTSRGLTPFLDYLRQRWEEGCHNAAQLAAELKEQGYTGSYYAVRRLLARWRPQQEGPREPGKGATQARRMPERPSSCRVAWLFLKDQAALEAEERTFLDRLYERCAELKAAAAAARAFTAMLHERRAEDFDSWLAQLQGDPMAKELCAFGESLKRDEAAVRAALSLEWSNGQVEGQVNRLKTIKRQMYGRAKFDLLRKRVLKTG